MLTAAPLAVVAQVVGPALDRIRAGSRVVVICSHLARAIFALLLASSLLSLAFYPLVFGILLSRKAYALAKTAMVAQLAPERTELVDGQRAPGAHRHDRRRHRHRRRRRAHRHSSASSGCRVVAAVVFVVAAMLASRIPIDRQSTLASRASSIRVETPVDVRRATPAVATIRAAEGALTFLLALSIKRGGGDEWIFVAALVAAGIGTFLGTMVSPRLHRAFSSDGIVVLTLLIPGAMSAFGVLTIGSLSIVAIALAIGLGGSVAARAMDALYGGVPHLMRGRVISRNELLFQLANVTGAAVAVLVYPGPARRIRCGRRRAHRSPVSPTRRSCGSRCGTRPVAGCSGNDRATGERGAAAWHCSPRRCASPNRATTTSSIVVADSAVRVLDARTPVSPECTAQSDWQALGRGRRRRQRRHGGSDGRDVAGGDQGGRCVDHRAIAERGGASQRQLRQPPFRRLALLWGQNLGRCDRFQAAGWSRAFVM